MHPSPQLLRTILFSFCVLWLLGSRPVAALVRSRCLVVLLVRPRLSVVRFLGPPSRPLHRRDRSAAVVIGSDRGSRSDSTMPSRARACSSAAPMTARGRIKRPLGGLRRARRSRASISSQVGEPIVIPKPVWCAVDQVGPSWMLQVHRDSFAGHVGMDATGITHICGWLHLVVWVEQVAEGRKAGVLEHDPVNGKVTAWLRHRPDAADGLAFPRANHLCQTAEFPTAADRKQKQHSRALLPLLEGLAEPLVPSLAGAAYCSTDRSADISFAACFDDVYDVVIEPRDLLRCKPRVSRPWEAVGSGSGLQRTSWRSA